MRWLPFAMVLLVVPTVRGDSKDKDLEPFQGNWKVELIEENGQREPEGEAARYKISILRETMTVYLDGRSETTTFKIDASTTPKSIDLTPNYGADKGRTFKGIYEFYGDRLRICAKPTGDRPKEFASGEGVLILLLRRSR